MNTVPDPLPRGMRLSNPGNIKISPILWIGKITPSNDPVFETFGRIEDGLRAACVLFKNYYTIHGLQTVRGLINRWAPPSDDNPTDTYVANVAAACGVDPDATIDGLEPATLCAIIGAVVRQEQGYPAVDPAIISAVVNEVLGATA